MELLKKIDVTGVSVTALSLNEQVEVMSEWAQQRVSKTVCVANVHMLIESRRNTKLRSALSKADIVTPDGMPLVWVMRALGLTSQDRVAGMDIFIGACRRCVEKDVSIYLLGSTQKTLDAMQRRLSKDFPTLKVAGVESPPFGPIHDTDYTDTVARVNQSGAGFLFVSLGCPKQERWMDMHVGKINAVMVGVGGVFPVFAGLQKHAPKWIRESGLEWLYRLVQEPKRLYKRYFSTIPPFICLASKQVLKSRQLRSPFGGPKRAQTISQDVPTKVRSF